MKRYLVYGLGRSGLAVARACVKRGWPVRIVDEAQESRLSKPELLEEARALGATVQLGFEPATGNSDCDVLVVNPAIPRRHPFLLRAVAEGIEVIGEIEFAYDIARVPMIAITGTNGKSTTTVMTYLALKAIGESPILCGNIFGSGFPEITLTEAADQAQSDNILVAEVSSFQLEWIREFHPWTVGITNITPDHLDRYDSFEAYAATKLGIFQNLIDRDFAVVPTRDPVVPIPSHPKSYTFGAAPADAVIGPDSIIVLGQEISTKDWKIYGEHNHRNAAMALLLTDVILQTVGRSRGQVPPEAIEALQNFRGLQHRMQWLGERNAVEVINNSMCTNPVAVIRSAESVGKTAHLLVGGVNKQLDFAPLAAFLATSPHHAYLFGTDAGSIRETLGADFPVFNTMAEAFTVATQTAAGGEVIMLAPGCASTDQFRDFRDRGNVFTALAEEWLKG